MQIEIRYSKIKTFRLLGLCSLFVIGGVLLAVLVPGYTILLWHFIPVSTVVAGWLLAAFFGALVAYLGRRMLGSVPGLIIDRQGLWRGKGQSATEKVLWTDIRSIKIIKVAGTRMIAFEIGNAQQLLDAETAFVKRKILETNIKNYGSGFLISDNALEYDFDALYTLLEKRLAESRKTRLGPAGA